ncbi:MAG: hypothetical protein REI09_09255 [Candidatus Dactylopiibacterium sp.]|nr:hypothetical protein [Candidatus Dactylopiibacterium sp.]
MNLYALLEPAIVTLLVVFGLWLSLRKVAPRLSMRLGEASRKAGLAPAIANRVFGPPPARNSACGTCCGCDKGGSQSKPMIHRH